MTLIPVRLLEITVPRSYRIAIVDAWWLFKHGNVFKTDAQGNYLFNHDKRVMENIFQKNTEEGFELRQLPLAFIERTLT
ncbi:hypothetical protein HVX40_24025 (plasmid) [Escherichia coli]|nr:hypothetical protein [Escherichia coli]MBA8354076.1 hypothetical protein [Escherichia coli]